MAREKNQKSKISEIIRLIRKAARRDYSVRLNPVTGNADLDAVLHAVNHLLEQTGKASEESVTTEKRLRESEGQYRSLVEDSTLGLYRTSPDGKILMANASAIRMLGYNSFDELAVRDLESTGFEPAYSRMDFKQKLETEGVIIGLESAWKRKDGSTMYVRESARAIRDRDGKVIYYDGTFEDITNRKQIEELLQKELHEKELLLKEIHHRVKNNLQIICSLLNLQSYKIREEDAKTAFQYCKNRIYSMALVHEQLYRSNDFSSIHIKPYVDMLMRELDKAYHISSNVTIHQDIQDITLGIDYAIPVGLILNELLTNAIKHAFPGRRQGDIHVVFRKHQNQTHEINVRDNGAGIPDDLNLEKTESLGLHMVKVLIKQINGEFDLIRSPGTNFIIRF